VTDPSNMKSGKINKDYPEAYYPNVVSDSSQIKNNDIITIFDKDVKKQMHKFKDTDFFKDPNS
jgi:hypothetical protein